MVSFELKGAKELEKKLKSFGKKGEKALMQALKETSIEGSSTMAENCPRVTGRLASSVHFETPTTKHYVYKDESGRGYIGTFRQTPKGLEVKFGTNVEYAEAANENSSKPKFFEKGISRARQVLPMRMKKNLDKIMKEK